MRKKTKKNSGIYSAAKYFISSKRLKTGYIKEFVKLNITWWFHLDYQENKWYGSNHAKQTRLKTTKYSIVLEAPQC